MSEEDEAYARYLAEQQAGQYEDQLYRQAEAAERSAQLRPVTQSWVAGLTMMQQSVLLTAVRGPDGVGKYHASKYLLRWYRRCILLSAMDGRALTDPFEPNGGSFTGPSIDVTKIGIAPADAAEHVQWEPMMDDVVGEYLKTLDELPHHFQLHLLHAIEIVGYKHPRGRIRAWWARVYIRLVRDMHLYPEPEDELDQRLGDDRQAWLERSDPAVTA